MTQAIPPHHVVEDELSIVHGADPGHKGDERANDGDEAGEDNGFAAMALVEPVRTIEVFLLEEANLARKGPRADVGSDPIVERIARNGGDRQEHEEDFHVHGPQPGESACGKQQRIAREEWSDHQARLAKDHGEEDQVGPSSISLDDLAQGPIEVDDVLEDQFFKRFNHSFFDGVSSAAKLAQTSSSSFRLKTCL